MGMTISSSGRYQHEYYLSPKVVTLASSCLSRKHNPHAICREKVIEMLKLENEYRLSHEWLIKMEEESSRLEYPMQTVCGTSNYRIYLSFLLNAHTLDFTF